MRALVSFQFTFESIAMVYRLKIIPAVLLSTAALMPVHTYAADMDPAEVIYVDDANIVKPAELGSGWYLRGDISYNTSMKQERGFTYGTSATFDYKYGDSIGYGIGFGKKLNYGLRMDMTLDHPIGSSTKNLVARNFAGVRLVPYSYADGTGATVTSSATVSFDALGNLLTSTCAASGGGDAGDACRAAASGGHYAINGQERTNINYSTWNVLANAYYDLPTVGGFTPYVGGGVGMTRAVASIKQTLECNALNNEACTSVGGATGEQVKDYVTIDNTYAKWLPTYSAAAGIAYDVSPNLSIDLGYRYTHTMNINSVLAGSTTIDPTLLNDAANIHSVRLGVRLKTW